MSASRKFTGVTRALVLSTATAAISLGWGAAPAIAQPTSAAHHGSATKSASAGQPPSSRLTASSYCHAGSRPVYSCGPYADYYSCEAIAAIFSMFGYWTSTCWYFPQGNFGGRGGYYF